MQSRQGVRGTARDADDAELAEPECLGNVLHVGDRLAGTPPHRELRPAHTRAVRRDDPQPELAGRPVDVRRLVMRADQPVKEEGREPGRIAVLPDLQDPAGSHDERVDRTGALG